MCVCERGFSVQVIYMNLSHLIYMKTYILLAQPKDLKCRFSDHIYNIKHNRSPTSIKLFLYIVKAHSLSSYTHDAYVDDMSKVYIDTDCMTM